MSTEQDELDNLTYQRWMADSLVASMGHDQAVNACREMGWCGTLDLLMNRRAGEPTGQAWTAPAAQEAI